MDRPLVKFFRFIAQMAADEDGTPDAAEFAFLASILALIVGAFFVTFHLPFPLLAFAGAVCTLIPLYRAARGDWRKP